MLMPNKYCIFNYFYVRIKKYRNKEKNRIHNSNKERDDIKVKIEKTTKIGELLEIAPEKAEILLNAGMHCIGCPASQEETIEEACMVHGIDIEELLKELNA